jgi:ribonuclease HI
MVAWIDGGSRGNPGKAGCGIVLQLPEGVMERHTLFLGQTTNNVAEYTALLAALERARDLGAAEIQVRTDSELMVKQLDGRYRVRANHLVPYWRTARKLLTGFTSAQVVHVPRGENRAADRLANQAMDTGVSSLPFPVLVHE